MTQTTDKTVKSLISGSRYKLALLGEASKVTPDKLKSLSDDDKCLMAFALHRYNLDLAQARIPKSKEGKIVHLQTLRDLLDVLTKFHSWDAKAPANRPVATMKVVDATIVDTAPEIVDEKS